MAVFADSFPPADDLLLEVGGEDLCVVHSRPHDAAGWRTTRVSPAGDALATLQADLPGSRPLAFLGASVLVVRVNDLGVTWFEVPSLGRACGYAVAPVLQTGTAGRTGAKILTGPFSLLVGKLASDSGLPTATPGR